MKHFAAFLVVGILLFSLSACSEAAEKPAVGDKLVNVPVTTLDGTKTTLVKLLKGRVVAFKFGTTWCGWCTKQFEEFEKAKKEYGDKVAFLDIDVKEPASKVKAHLKRHKYSTPTVLDPKGKAAEKYNVQGFPTLLIAGHDATVLLRGYYVPFEKFKPILDKAVAAAAAAKKK
ncbi:TlpA family protein disulfide reductase [bacterium]|nr:TlpA family protein disulfide reductase [bacterium]